MFLNEAPEVDSLFGTFREGLVRRFVGVLREVRVLRHSCFGLWGLSDARQSDVGTGAEVLKVSGYVDKLFVLSVFAGFLCHRVSLVLWDVMGFMRFQDLFLPRNAP